MVIIIFPFHQYKYLFCCVSIEVYDNKFFLMKSCPIVFLTREDWIFPASCLELIYKLCPLNVWHLLRYVRPAVDTSPRAAVTARHTTSSAAKAVIGHSNPVPDRKLKNEPIPSNDSSYNRAGLQRKHIIYASVTLQSQRWKFKSFPSYESQLFKYIQYELLHQNTSFWCVIHTFIWKSRYYVFWWDLWGDTLFLMCGGHVTISIISVSNI